MKGQVGSWTTEKPTKPGYYWVRLKGRVEAVVAEVFFSSVKMPSGGEELGAVVLLGDEKVLPSEVVQWAEIPEPA